MSIRRRTSIIMLLLIVAGGVTNARARIKLVALPERADAIIRLDNPNATLIEEERTLTLQKGVNKVDFSWNGVSINVDSIRLTPVSGPGTVTLLNVSYPPGEAALVWEIACTEASEQTVRISYLLSNIDRLVAYKALANKAETEVALKSYLVLRNFSGEDFSKARVQLDYGEAFEESIQHEETKRLLFFEKASVPIRKIWKWDSRKQPWDPEKQHTNVGIPVYYSITNSAAVGLGAYALWGGKVRVFQDDGSNGSIFLGEDDVPLTPVGEAMEVYIGDSRDIVVTQRKMREKKINIRRNSSGDIVLYDTDEIITAKIENFKDTPAVLTMTQHIPGQWDMVKCNLDYRHKDAETLEFMISLPPGGKRDLNMHYHRRNLRN